MAIWKECWDDDEFNNAINGLDYLIKHDPDRAVRYQNVKDDALKWCRTRRGHIDTVYIAIRDYYYRELVQAEAYGELVDDQVDYVSQLDDKREAWYAARDKKRRDMREIIIDEYPKYLESDETNNNGEKTIADFARKHNLAYGNTLRLIHELFDVKEVTEPTVTSTPELYAKLQAARAKMHKLNQD